jgi:hypothetical protein
MTGILIVNVVASCAVVAIFFWLAKAHHGTRWIAGVSLVSACIIARFSPILFGQLALTGVLALIASPFKPNGRVLKSFLIIAPLVCYGTLVWTALPELRERDAIQREYPMVSLAERLKYEASAGPVDAKPQVELPEKLLQRLEETESRKNGFSPRTHALARAHNSTHADFIAAAGFGSARVLKLRRRYVELPDLSPIPYESAPTRGESRFDANGSAAEVSDEPISSERFFLRSDLLLMHDESFLDFFDPLRMGYVRDVRHVAGFQSHRFSQMPGTETIERNRWQRKGATMPNPPPRVSWRRRWPIVRLELIGMLRHGKPVAYVSDHLPQLEELASYPIRDLTDFEQSALDQLRDKEDVVIDYQPNRIRMVGSLRADQNCQKCHSVARSELLGALSYELLPE